MKHKFFSPVLTKQSSSDLIFDILNHTILSLFMLLILYLLYFIIIVSFFDSVAINNGKVFFLPVSFNILWY
mgnify:CR=1 FL=1